jgi:hypothetical protein
VNLIGRKWKPRKDFISHHLGVRDDGLGIGGIKNFPLESQDLGVFAINPSRKPFPYRIKPVPPLKPCSVNSISRSKNITTRNALETEVHIASRL